MIRSCLLQAVVLIVGVSMFIHAPAAANASTNSLWLSVAGVSNGWVNLILNGTVSGSNYVLLSKQVLADPGWTTAGTIIGATNQNWTLVSVPVGAQSSYFFQAQSAAGQTPSANLWIAQARISSGSLVGIMSNSQANITYEIQSLTDLTQAGAGWNSEGFILGSELTNWTPMSVAQNGRTKLFLRIRSWVDSTGSGIPDWWWWQYFGQITNVDPYALDPAEDGYDNLQKFQMGLNPTNFYSPPAPIGLYAYVDSTGTNALISWSPAQGAVTNYIIYRGIYDFGTGNYDYSQVAVVSASTTSFEDVGGYNPSSGNYYAYGVAAGYPGGGSSQSAFSYLHYTPPTPPTPTYNLFAAATLVRNATGRWQLMFAGLPASVQTIQLTWTDISWNTTSQNISASSLTNGIYYIPDTDVINYLGDSLSVQLTETNGTQSEVVQAGVLPNDAPYFVDGRQHMKQNHTGHTGASD